MGYETLLTSMNEGILEITLNRTAQMNAINQKMLDELDQVVAEAETSESVKCLIIIGGEKFFCAGADITEVSKVDSTFSGFNFSRKYQKCMEKFENLSKPVIAAVRGYALGGGCELMLGCDFRIVAENAAIGLPECKIGAIPAGGGTIKLPQMINPLKAKEILCFGDPISGKEAEAIGLVNKAVPFDEVLTEARAWAAKLAQRPPLVLRTIKALTAMTTKEMKSLYHLEAQGLGMLVGSADFKEGTSAFLEKRKPVFKGV
jgi:enoyl-CoA hydratase